MLTISRRLPAAFVVACLGTAALACSDQHAITNVEGVQPVFSATRTSIDFTVGPLALGGINIFTPGGNLHFRDIQLSGPVTGEIAGSATFTLNANLDGFGNGPTWGTVTITSGSDVWQGDLAGHFQGDLPTGILLTSRVTLHGPGQQLLKAECDEIPPSNSETLACEAEVTNPGE